MSPTWGSRCWATQWVEGYRRKELRRKIEAMWWPLLALAHIQPQSAFILLKECVDARPCYLERVAESELMWEALEEFVLEITAKPAKCVIREDDGDDQLAHFTFVPIGTFLIFPN